MIIFVDDSRDLCELVTQLLTDGIPTPCLALVSMAEVISQSERVLASRVVILDINLGTNQPDGLEIHSWLKENQYLGHVLFLTGHGRHHPRVVEAIKTGVQVMEKPISAPEFLQFVKAALRRGADGENQ